MSWHLGHQFVELLGRDEALSDLTLLRDHRKIWFCELQLFLPDGESHHAAQDRKIAVDRRVVGVLITSLFSKRTEYVRVHLVEPHSGKKLVKHFQVAFVRIDRDRAILLLLFHEVANFFLPVIVNEDLTHILVPDAPYLGRGSLASAHCCKALVEHLLRDRAERASRGL